MNIVVHLVAFGAPLVLCWGVLVALLWVLDWRPYWDTYSFGAFHILLCSGLTLVAVVLGVFAVLSPFLPLWVGP